MADWRTELDEVIRPHIARSKIVREVVMDPGAIAQAGALLNRHFAGRQAVVVTDHNCHEAAGEKLIASLRGAGYEAQALVIDEHLQPEASVETAEQLANMLAGKDAIPVALGSGLINDLLKHVSLCNGRDYCTVATAASMDGYAAEVAPLSKKGFKTARPGRAPLAVLADLDVIAAAPAKMAGHGYADMVSKIPAGADWLIADSLGIEPINDKSFKMVQNNLLRWLADPERLRSGDLNAYGLLFSGLVVVGLAMESYGSSRPASGAEHNIGHCWEMEFLTYEGCKVAHGACVAVGTLAILDLYEWLLKQDLTRLDPDQIVTGSISLKEHFVQIEQSFANPEIVERAKQETANKYARSEQLRERLDVLRESWSQLQEKLRAQLRPKQKILAWLEAAGAPTKAADIGVSHAELVRTVLRGRYLRDRYTILDLLAETGMLEQAVSEALQIENA